MTYPIESRMSEILALTKAGKLTDAAGLIQRSLGSNGLGQPTPTSSKGAPIDLNARGRPALPGAGVADRSDTRLDTSGRFDRKTFHGSHGNLDYFVYVPAKAEAGMPLVVMLHGCTQSAEDFARGTRMNDLADELGFVVAYPEQPQSANVQKCWNWFRPGDQGKDAGEPALIAGITREIIRDHQVDRSRVYVAGLSAGGAAAAIMAAAYPDIYAAAGIHSGLACGSARDLPSALAAMNGKGRKKRTSARAYVPLITFHGDLDRTVHPVNSEQIHAEWISAPHMASIERKVVEGTSPTGRHHRKTAMVDHAGRSLSESWELSGAGHAWSGGSPSGSYTDSDGPDASREMLRFFLQHRLGT